MERLEEKKKKKKRVWRASLGVKVGGKKWHEEGPVCLCRPPLLPAVIYHGRRRRAGGNFVPTSPLAARIAIQPARYNFIIPAK